MRLTQSQGKWKGNKGIRGGHSARLKKEEEIRKVAGKEH